MAFFKRHTISFGLITGASLIAYLFFAFEIKRTALTSFLSIYGFLFVAYLWLVKKQHYSFRRLVGISLLLRSCFLFSIPALSQDFYRFIWDGRMIFEGFNPYISLPQYWIEHLQYPVHQATLLYQGMGSLNGGHFTNYPPINQWCFWMAALLSNKSILGAVVVLRIQIIAADIGILYVGKKIMEHIGMPSQKLAWYALNPFVIVELTGNLHFEPVMLFFLLWSLYLLLDHKWVWSGILMACSIAVKLIPLLFLPLFYQWFVKKERRFSLGLLKLFGFYSLVGISLALLFLPFYDNALFANYSSSVTLWFRKFEFNASIYYVLRAIGYQLTGYNQIAIIGKILPLITVIFIGCLSLFRKNDKPKELFTALLFGLSFYYFTTTTMHPWYLASLVILSIFSRYRFPIVWSGLIILSYTAYGSNETQENLWLVALEYLVVYGFLLWELFFKDGSNKKDNVLPN